MSIPEVNNSTLAVSAPMNISIKLGFVSVNGSTENHFGDALSRGEKGNPTRKANAVHNVSHELEMETRRYVSLLLPPCVPVPKLYSISREA